MIGFKRNNLDKAISPYLQQHKNNPIHWQEWSNEVLLYAKEQKKILFVSVGYATCHWCHVMAAEAFSDNEVADYLNANFISIKVDREQRPDIDHYLMSFLVETQGQGGWPLNAFLEPDIKPLMAVTYVPVTAQYGMMPFIELLKFVKNSSSKASPMRYMPRQNINEGIEEQELIKVIINNFDAINGGFGSGMKFPPHNTLLFLLSYYEKTKDTDVKNIIEVTLNKMALGGLHDHLQGGFYRYCTDRTWTIPHFEKMLYDQAMLLWVYSVAYHVLKNEEYKTVAEKIIKCLQDTFEEDGLFYSAHDADTDHNEGATYLWTEKELKEILGDDFNQFIEIYDISEYGNFEGKNHLIKKNGKFLLEVENKLLQIRNKRRQPFTDKKIITSWNALTGIGLLIASRYLENNSAKIKAKKLFERLLEKHYFNGKLCHSSLGNDVQSNGFLEDYASMLLFATLLYQEYFEGKEIIVDLSSKLKEFYSGKWHESKNEDFIEIPAQTVDHPIPSSVSLAECASLFAKIILNQNYGQEQYAEPLARDFFNVMAFVKNGNWHEIHTPQKIEWKELPFNSIQIPSEKIQDCYNKKCLEFANIKKLLENLN